MRYPDNLDYTDRLMALEAQIANSFTPPHELVAEYEHYHAHQTRIIEQRHRDYEADMAYYRSVYGTYL